MLLPRFYPILDTEIVTRHNVHLIDAATQILGAGARILQFRHKGHFSRHVFADLERIADLCRQANAQLVVNDRADLARLLGAALHLGQDDLSPSEARRVVGPETPIGYSTHNSQQLQASAAEPADYLAIGPIFGTSSKANPDPIVGLDGLRHMRHLTTRPLVAIGGITRSTARSVIEAGTNSIAVIGDLFPDIKNRVTEFISITA